MKDTTQFLTYLRTIISTGSVTAAAKRLYISQPYLSRTISEHERRLGYRLLDRDKRPIALTAIGVQYVRTLEQLNNQYNKLMHDLEKMADVSHLRLGINQSMSTIVAPRYCIDIIRFIQKVRLRLLKVFPANWAIYCYRGELTRNCD